MSGIVLDASAVIAMLESEPDATALREALIAGCAQPGGLLRVRRRKGAGPAAFAARK